MKKRLLAMMMAFVMAMSLLPMSALAVDAGGETPEPSAPANAEGLEVSKIATANGDGTYKLTMEAYTTGTVTSSTSSKPCDIVLVLDQSTSMSRDFSKNQTVYEPIYASRLEKKKTYYVGYNEVRWCQDCSAWTSGCWDSWFWGHQVGKTYVPKTSADDATKGHVQFTQKVYKPSVTRLEAMKSAAVQFVNQVAAQDHGHRIAIVGFHDEAIQHTNFLDAATQATTLTNKINAISSSDLDYATEHGKGLAKARELLTDDADSEEREKVVILFTDGEPEPWNKSYWSGRIVKQAIEEASTLKNTHSASVYCISVLPGDNDEMNTYMNAISSNYPSAIYTGNGNEVDKDKVSPKINLNEKAAEGYYLKATNISELEEHFKKITTDVITPTISLDATTVLKDVVTEYFTPGADDVVVKTVPCTGRDETTGAYTWDDDNAEILKIIPTVNSNEDGTTTISVTGFDYDENFVSETARKVKGSDFYGKKLVVEVKVTPKEGFWGGNNVPTNADTSGIYDKDGEIVEAFPVPQVNVPLRVPDLTGKNVNIYCGNTAPAVTDLVEQDGAFITDQGTWKTDFVIVGDVALKDGSGPISNVEDGNYTFGATVTPEYKATTNVGDANDMSGVVKEATGSVSVYKPVITFQDTTIEKGTSANYSKNLVKTEWKHGTGETATTDTGVTMLDKTRPDLTLTYNPNAAKFDDDQNVAVTQVQNGSTDIKDYTTFGWQKNTESSQCADCTAAPTGNQFRVHVVDTTPIPTPANITISKKVDDDTPAPGQTVTYSITLTNSGETAGTVTVVDTLPKNLNVAPTDISDSGSYSTGEITWTGISVHGKTGGVNGTLTLTYKVKIPDSAEPGTTYDNKVKIGDGGADKEATKTVTVTAAKLTASKTAPATVAPGGQLKYEITVSNSGNAPAENVVITDTVWQDFDINKVTVDNGGTLDKDARQITWTIASIEAGDSKTVSFQVTVPENAADGVKYSNTAVVNGVSTNTTETEVDVASVSISGTKIVKQGGNVAAPSNAEFTFTLSQVIDKKTTVVQTKNGGAGDFTFDPIRYTEAGTYVYEVKETAGSAANWTYDNTTYTVTVTVSPDKDVNKLVVSAPVYSVGDTKADKMTFTNTYTKNESTGGGGNHKPPVLNKEDHYAYIVGYPDGTVKPQGNITRAEVATIFFRMLTDDSRNEFWSQTNSYSDVSEGQWFNNAISTLANAGILSGYPDGTFRPNAPITRAEFTKIAASFFERVEYTIDNPFNDVDDDDWFYKFVMAAYEGGLITGYPEGDFRPNANISRAESVTIVNRTLERAPDADHFLKDMIVWPDNAENAWYYEAVQEATNSHEYVVKGTGTNKYEEWTKILEVRDWPALEKDWSNANSAAGGEVVK